MKRSSLESTGSPWRGGLLVNEVSFAYPKSGIQNVLMSWAFGVVSVPIEALRKAVGIGDLGAAVLLLAGRQKRNSEVGFISLSDMVRE